MSQISSKEAQDIFQSLIQEVLEGKEVIITKGRVPISKITSKNKNNKSLKHRISL